MLKPENEEGLTLRRMRREDLSAVLELENTAFSDPWPPEAFSDDIIDTGWLLLKDETLIGYTFVIIVIDECSLINVAVSPAFQQKGYGLFMMRELISRFYKEQKIRYYYLDVRSSNIPAQRLYTRLGFKQLGIRKGYYHKPPEDAIVMGLILPQPPVERKKY